MSDDRHAPKDHHYVPAGYLRAWEHGEASKLIEFKRPIPDRLASRTVKAKSTGFERHLYSIETGEVGKLDHSFESNYLKYIDEGAAVLLQRMRESDLTFSHDERITWARFVLSLCIRTPEDFSLHREFFEGYWGEPDPVLEARYQDERPPEYPETLSQFLQTVPEHERDKVRLQSLARFLNASDTLKLIVGLRWHVKHFSAADLTLMTSDRPIVSNFRLGFPEGFLFLPIAPDKLFVARAGPALSLGPILGGTDNQAVKFANRAVVRQARRYVWAASQTHEKFVSRWMGTITTKSMPEMLVEAMNNGVSDLAKPTSM
ncbi:MAG: DUF4238 domain-containing protein [Paracoccaceae bacterium]|nr:DUF4238 domain-containing protein [Paracoccaceae bacterium]